MENNGIKILAIDDNEDNLFTLRVLISDAFPDAAVFTATGGEAGIKIAHREDPDVILLDVIMPGMDGFEVCTQLKHDALLKNIPVVFVTAIKDDRNSRIRALEVGAEAFLAKPIDQSELVAQIRAMLKVKQLNISRMDENKRLAELVVERTKELHSTHLATLNLLEDLRNEVEGRKRTEADLRASEERLLRAEIAGKTGNWELDRTTGRMIVSKGAMSIYGISKSELEHEEVKPQALPEYREIIDEGLRKLVEEGVDFDVYFRIRNLETQQLVDIHSIATFDKERNKIFGVISDVTFETHTKEALRASEALYRSVIQASPDNITVTDLEGNIQMLSPVGLKLFGYASDDVVLGRNIYEFLLPAQHERAREKLEQMINGIFNGPEEYSIQKSEGQIVDTEINAEFVRDGQGNPCGFVFAIRDITERKAIQRKIAESEALYRAIIDASPDHIVITDTDGTVLKLSPSALKAHGYSREEEVIGKSIYDFVAPEYLDKMKSDFEKRTTTGEKTGPNEYKVLTKSGDSYFAEVNGGLITDEEGKIVRFVSISRDVTERKQIQEALQQSEERYRSIFENTLTVMLIIDPESGYIADANPAACQFYGWALDELKRKKITEIINSDSDGVLHDIRSVLKGNSYKMLRQHRLANGDLCHVEVNAAPVVIDGKIMLYSIIEDVSKRLKAESALRNSEEKYRLITEKISDVVWLMDLQGKSTFVSKSIEKFTGYTVEEYLEQTISDRFTEESAQVALAAFRSEVKRYLELHLQTKEYVATYILEYRCKDGKTKFGEMLITPNVNSDGILVGIHGVTRDITERLKVERALRESDERYNTFINNNKDMIFVKDSQMRYLVANQSMASFYNVEVDAIIGKTDQELAGESGAIAPCVSSDMKVLSGLEFYNQEEQLGDHIYETTKFPMKLGNGELGIGGIIHNITNRKQAEQKLQYVTRLYALLSQINQTIVHVKTEKALFESICGLAIEYGHFRMCWLGILDAESGDIRPVSMAGYHDGYPDKFPININDTSGGGSYPVAHALVEGKAVYSNNIETDEVMSSWRDEALQRGYRSAFAVPIHRKGKVYGCLALYASETDFFDDEECKLLQEVSVDISYALDVMDSEKERLDTEHALVASESKYRDFVEYSPEAIAIYQNGKVVYVNLECLRLMRAQSKEQLIGTNVIDFIHPDNRQLVFERMSSLADSSIDIALPAVEEKYIRLDGTAIYVEVKAMPIVLEGQPAVQLTARDITDRKQVEDALEQSRVELKAIYDHAPVMMCVVDGQRNIYFANNAFNSINGLFEDISSSGVVGNVIGCIYSFEDPKGCGHGRQCNTCTLRMALDDTYRTGQSHRNIEYQSSLLINDHAMDISLLGSTALINTGTERRVLLCLHDITDRKHAEEALQKSEMLLRTFIDNSPFEIWARDIEGVGILENRMLVNHFGSIVGKRLNSDPNADPNIIKLLEASNLRAYSGEVFEEEYEFSDNGKMLYYQQIIFPIRDSDRIIGIAGFNIDVSEKKAAERQLRESKEELAQFSSHLQIVREDERSNLAREIHDDLGQILIAMKIDMGLLKNIVLKNVLPQDLERIKAKFEEIQQLVDNTLKSARRIMTDLRPEVLDLLGLTETIVQHLKGFENRYKTVCQFVNNTSEHNLFLNPTQAVALYRIVQEALNNVAKYAKATEVKVSINMNDDTVVLRIADDGIGFDLNEKRRNDSYGLLGIRERAVLLNGSSTIYSQPGKGTIVEVVFNVSENS